MKLKKMKSFVFKAYDTFVGFQLYGSSTIYPNTHWLNQKWINAAH